MKKGKFFVCLLSLMFFVLAFAACQGGGGAESMRGTIAKNAGGGYNFTSGGKTYMVEGQQDLNALVGKFVNVQGTVTEKEGKSVITVASVKE